MGVTEYLKDVLPEPLRGQCSRAKRYFVSRYGDRPYFRNVDLSRILIAGEGPLDALTWAEKTGDWQRISTLLPNSPYVKFLEAYQVNGKKVLDATTFSSTTYFRNAAECIEHWGHYFGQRDEEGIRAQARAFIELFERIRRGDRTPVIFPSETDHAPAGSFPEVTESLTKDTYQVHEGHHRLAIAWALGKREVKVKVLRPPVPTGLQALVLKVSQTQGRQELYQPIDGPDFDNSWGLVRRCQDRLDKMLEFLAAGNHSLDGLSVVDLACSYGWFVSQFSARGCNAVGVEQDPNAIRIGRAAYRLAPSQVVQSDFQNFASGCGRRFDVVLLLSVFHYFPLKRATGTPEEVIKAVDAITGSVLFFDTGQSHEAWWRDTLPEWDDRYIVEFIKAHSSFNQVIPLGPDSDNVPPYQDNYRRTLFACIRS